MSASCVLGFEVCTAFGLLFLKSTILSFLNSELTTFSPCRMSLIEERLSCFDLLNLSCFLDCLNKSFCSWLPTALLKVCGGIAYSRNKIVAFSCVNGDCCFYFLINRNLIYVITFPLVFLFSCLCTSCQFFGSVNLVSPTEKSVRVRLLKFNCHRNEHEGSSLLGHTLLLALALILWLVLYSQILSLWLWYLYLKFFSIGILSVNSVNISEVVIYKMGK